MWFFCHHDQTTPAMTRLYIVLKVATLAVATVPLGNPLSRAAARDRICYRYFFLLSWPLTSKGAESFLYLLVPKCLQIPGSFHHGLCS